MRRFVSRGRNGVKNSRLYEASKVTFEETMPDEDDRVFYEVSLSQEDSFLITGNLKHYPASPRVITPADFIDLIEMKGERVNG